MITTDEAGGADDGSGDDDTPAAPVAYPDITSNVRLVAPQLSLNFGTGAGWSYISAGISLGRVKTEGSAAADGTALVRDSGTATGFNVGAGARWFLNRHLGVGFDLRLHRLSTATVFSAAAGLSLK
jgi:opacity protein-like surface antigen